MVEWLSIVSRVLDLIPNTVTATATNRGYPDRVKGCKIEPNLDLIERSGLAWAKVKDEVILLG